MGWLANIFGSRQDEAQLALYNAIVLHARTPHWYVEGAVPDTVDGRFDMVAAVLAFVLLRLEQDPQAAGPSALLTERFIDDMDGQLRQMGIGDIVVGKHIGKMMAMLGGRMGAYRDGLADANHGYADLDAALVRNLYRGEAPPPGAVAHVRDALLALHAAFAATSTTDIIEGRLP